MALGFPIGRMGAPPEERSVAFGWPGGGGSYAYADPARSIAFALTKTRLAPDFETARSVSAILADGLGGISRASAPQRRIMSTPIPSADDDGATEPQTSLGPFSSPGATPAPWEQTEGALRRIQKFHLCTVRRDGRPHVTPLLATWAFGAMWFTTGHDEQKARNLGTNPHCALTTGTDTLTGTDYVIEGTASLVTDEAAREAAATAFEQAYGWHLTREDGTWYGLGDAVRTGTVQLYRVRPDRGFAFAIGGESSQTRYRWR
jgi:nitroimidazol reductase NimA-like FMN-containing flavoprotein (pyridoxamine 5'-phosphate oxidase superfamily)